MREYVGACTSCEKDVYCTDGFLNGLVLENGDLVCFECQDNNDHSRVEKE